ncbi:MAG TPA: choice-of-anchor D domain-containing protein [Acidobacteriaceae bacterium]
MLDGDQQPFCNGNAQLRSIAAGAGASGGEQIYAGMAGPYDGGGVVPGHVYTSAVPQGGGQTSWVDLYESPVTNAASSNYHFNPGGFAASSVAVDPHDATGQTVYVTVQGVAGNGVSGGLLYGSTDGGAHWLNLTNSLPSAPANSVVVDPNAAGTVYVALDTGVYWTTNIASCATPTNYCWALYGGGLPNAPVTELKIYNAGGKSLLEAATYGRGIWSLGLTSLPSTGTLTPASYTFTPAQQVQTASAAATFVLQNTGSSAMTISQVSTTGDYAATNGCGQTLAGGANCSIGVTFTPTAAGDRPGTLTVTANVGGGQLSSSLDGTGVTAGALSATRGSLIFPATNVGAVSAAETVTITNTGGASVALQAPVIAGDYALSSTTCGSTLAGGASCVLAVTFAPTAAGDRVGTLSVPGSQPGSPLVVPLDGSGVAPAALTLTPGSLTFSATVVGSVSAAQGITVTNTGGSGAQLQAATVPGDYGIASNSCGATLAAGASCVVQVTFAPTAVGSRPGLLTQQANVAGGQVTAGLNGTGVAPGALSVSPTSLTFAATPVGATTAAQGITVTNTGGVAVQVNAPAMTGDYAVASNSCGALPPGASCAIQVTFTPTAVGTRAGLLAIRSNLQAGNPKVPLSGVGVAPAAITMSPGSLVFGATVVGGMSAAQTITVTNTGGAAAQLQAPGTSGDFAVSTTNCGATLAAGASCTAGITFKPTAVGARTGLVSVAGSFVGSPSTAQLSGTGAAAPTMTLSPSPAAFGSVLQGGASQPLSITVDNTGLVAAQLQAPAVTAEFQVSANGCGSSLGAGATCVVQVVFHPAGTGARTGTLTLAGTMAGGQVTDALSGTGLTPGLLTLTPTSLSYGEVVVQGSSAAQQVTLANQGGTTVTLQAPTVTGDYQLSGNTCGSSLAAGATCVMQVVFHPQQAGDRAGQLQVPDTASGGALVATLDGTGLAPGSVSLTPGAVSFGAVPVGASSGATAVVAANAGGVMVHLQAPTASGDYSVAAGTCGASLAPGGTCTMQVVFSPTTTGTRHGTLSLASDAPGSPAQAALSGTGVTPGTVSLSPATLSFPGTVVGATSAAMTEVATNGGGAPVTLGAAVVTGDFELGATTCGATLAPGATCTLLVTFAPTAAGQRTGGLSLPGQFSSSPATAALTGAGLAPGALTLTPGSLSYGAVVLGKTATLGVSVTDTGGVAVQMGTPSASGDYRIVSNTCGGSLAAGASCSLQVLFAPAAVGTRSGLLTVPGAIAGGQVTAALEGTGVAPGALALTPGALSFGVTAVNTASAAQTLMLGNTGGVGVTLQTPVISGGFIVASNGCGSVLAAGATCTLAVEFDPTVAGSVTGTLTVSGTGSGQQAQATLTGTGAAAAIGFSPATLEFGSQQEGKSTAAQSATLSNTGGIAAQLGLPVLTGDYRVAGNTCGSTLGPGATCVVQVVFSPTALGDRRGTLTVSVSGGGGTAAVSLDGQGTPPHFLVLTPTAVTFAAVAVGSTSPGQNVTVANAGTTTVQTTAPVVTGAFGLTADTCTGTSLAPGTSCTLTLRFQPTAAGAQAGTLTVTDGAETETATLSGTAMAGATDTLSTNALTFAPQVVGTVSAAQGVTMTNSGGATLGLIATQVTGPFLVSNGCGSQLGGGLSCTINVSYAPTAAGTESGTLVVTDNTPRSQTVTLTGSGVLPPTASLTPVSVDFGAYAVGAQTPVQVVTVNNNGTSALSGLVVVASGGPGFAIASNGCGASLAVGANCAVGVAFTPAQVGHATGVLTVSSPSLSGTLTAALAGSGEDFALTVVGSPKDVTTSGQTATYNLAVTPVGASSGTLTFTCAGAPANAVCTLNPISLSVAGGASGSLQVQIKTGVSGASVVTRYGVRGALAGVLASLLLPFALRRGRGARAFGAVAVAGMLMLAPTACGVHASGGATGTPPGGGEVGSTPAGTYTITVTGSFPGAERQAVLTLIVQ